MNHWLLLVFGLLISAIGLANIMGNISTIHSYNRRRVREEDIPRYGRAVGTGTLIIGLAFVVGFFLSLWNEALVAYMLFPALAVGLGFMLYGQIKYNHGIF